MRYIKLIVLLHTYMYGFTQDFQPVSGVLHALNQSFHSDYNELVSATVEGFGKAHQPVMVFTGDSLILRSDNTRKASRIIPPEYHLLKAIDHLPLDLFALVSQWKEGQISQDNLIKLQAHKELIDKVRMQVKTSFTAPELFSRQEAIVHASLLYVTDLLENKMFSKLARDIFCRSLSKLLLANADAAAKMEIENLHAQVSTWRKEIDSVSFKNVYVVIGSSHQARYRETTVQYFEKVLHERIGSTALNEKHLVFAESVFDEKGCLSTLARHIIDQKIGLVFFGDSFRMQRDLLSDAASKYIDQIFGNQKK